VRPGTDTITAPPFPTGLRWLNVSSLRMDKQRGRPVLIEFWDFCRVNSLRTLPYVQAWHERYAGAGLRVISIHAPGFEPGRQEDAVAAAVTRLGIAHAVALDSELELWSLYGNEGWPARYLFDGEGRLAYYHYGEGAYAESELAIQELLGLEGKQAPDPIAPLRPTDDPDALIVIPTADQQGAYSGPYEAGEVWAVVSGAGTVRVNGVSRAVTHPGAELLIAHERHTAAVLELELSDGVACHATCFMPGLAP
jgi:thiol-disulfide isomerase/thioredoxin